MIWVNQSLELECIRPILHVVFILSQGRIQIGTSPINGIHACSLLRRRPFLARHAIFPTQRALFVGKERLRDEDYVTSQKNVCVGGYHSCCISFSPINAKHVFCFSFWHPPVELEVGCSIVRPSGEWNWRTEQTKGTTWVKTRIIPSPRIRKLKSEVNTIKILLKPHDHLTKIPIGSSVSQIAISENSRKRPPKPDIKGGRLQEVPLS